MLQGLNLDLIRLAKQKEGLTKILEISESQDILEKTSAIKALGIYGGRPAFKRLFELAFDDDILVQGDAIMNLGSCGDSRAFFVHAYCFFHPELLRRDLDERSKTEILKSILYGFIASRDQRALPLLRDVTQEQGFDKDLASIAKTAIGLLEKRSCSKFLYDFLGNETYLEQAEGFWGITLSNQNSFAGIRLILDREAQMTDRTHYQTYIVSPRQEFIIGGTLEEHVMVASGKRVLAAGEVLFEKDQNGKWFIKYINNRSNGYFPSAESYPQVISALRGKNIGYPSKFSETFPREGYTTEEFLSIRWNDISRLLGN
jgi:hypothetical protein